MLIQLVIQLYCKAKWGTCLKYCKEFGCFFSLRWINSVFTVTGWPYECCASIAWGDQAEPTGYFQQLYKHHVCFVTPQTEWDIHVAMLISRPCCHFGYEVASSLYCSQARRPVLKLWIQYALGIYFTGGLMLSKGYLPLKRVVLFLALSLPLHCLSVL